MQTHLFSTMKNYWRILILFLPITMLLLNSSCNEKKEKYIGMDISCAVLLHEKIQDAWETPGHLKSINYLTFYSSYNRMTREFNVAVMGFKQDNTSIGNYVGLNQGKGCNISLPNNIAIGENLVELATLNITNPDGTLKDFDYIKLTPQPDPENDIFMSFKIEIVTGGVGRTIERGSFPCPPCPNCKPICYDKKIIDSLPNPIDTTGKN